MRSGNFLKISGKITIAIPSYRVNSGSSLLEASYISVFLINNSSQYPSLDKNLQTDDMVFPASNKTVKAYHVRKQHRILQQGNDRNIHHRYTQSYLHRRM